MGQRGETGAVLRTGSGLASVRPAKVALGERPKNDRGILSAETEIVAEHGPHPAGAGVARDIFAGLP